MNKTKQKLLKNKTLKKANVFTRKKKILFIYHPMHFFSSFFYVTQKMFLSFLFSF